MRAAIAQSRPVRRVKRIRFAHTIQTTHRPGGRLPVASLTGLDPLRHNTCAVASPAGPDRLLQTTGTAGGGR